MEQLASGIDVLGADACIREQQLCLHVTLLHEWREDCSATSYAPSSNCRTSKVAAIIVAFQRGDSGVQVVSCFRDSPPHDHRWQYGLSLGLGAVEHVIYDFGGYCGIAYSYVLVGLLHLTKPLFAIAVGCCNSALKDIQAARPKQWNIGEDIGHWRDWMIEMRHLTRIWDAVQQAKNSALSRWFRWKSAYEVIYEPTGAVGVDFLRPLEEHLIVSGTEDPIIANGSFNSSSSATPNPVTLRWQQQSFYDAS